VEQQGSISMLSFPRFSSSSMHAFHSFIEAEAHTSQYHMSCHTQLASQPIIGVSDLFDETWPSHPIIHLSSVGPYSTAREKDLSFQILTHASHFPWMADYKKTDYRDQAIPSHSKYWSGDMIPVQSVK